MAEEVRRRLEQARSKVKETLERITGGAIGGKFSPQIAGGRVSEIAQDVVNAVNEYVSSVKSGTLAETMRRAPLRSALERRIPALSKLPKIRSTVGKAVPLSHVPPTVSPTTPPAPKVVPEGRPVEKKVDVAIF